MSKLVHCYGLRCQHIVDVCPHLWLDFHRRNHLPDGGEKPIDLINHPRLALSKPSQSFISEFQICGGKYYGSRGNLNGLCLKLKLRDLSVLHGQCRLKFACNILQPPPRSGVLSDPLVKNHLLFLTQNKG